jgi:hypothetical protein
MLLRQAKPLGRLLGKFSAAFAVRLGRARHFRNAFPDQGVRDNHLRFPVVALFRNIERVEKLPHVLAVDFLHVKAVGAETHPVSSLCVSSPSRRA